MKQQTTPKPIKLDPLPNFNSIEKRVFTDHKGTFYIGTEKMAPEMRDLLREQSKYFSTSQLYDILKATIQHEAAQLALIQSKDFEEVLSAKMLWHWQFVLDNMLHKLTQ